MGKRGVRVSTSGTILTEAIVESLGIGRSKIISRQLFAPSGSQAGSYPGRGRLRYSLYGRASEKSVGISDGAHRSFASNGRWVPYYDAGKNFPNSGRTSSPLALSCLV